MKKINAKYISWTLALLIPSISYAQFNGVRGYLAAFAGLLNTFITIIFGLAMVYFFWGIAQFIL